MIHETRTLTAEMLDKIKPMLGDIDDPDLPYSVWESDNLIMVVDSRKNLKWFGDRACYRGLFEQHGIL